MSKDEKFYREERDALKSLLEDLEEQLKDATLGSRQKDQIARRWHLSMRPYSDSILRIDQSRLPTIALPATHAPAVEPRLARAVTSKTRPTLFFQNNESRSKRRKFCKSFVEGAATLS